MRIFLVTTDISGDLHGSLLARSLKELSPSLEIEGAGGNRMASAGVKIHIDLTPYAVIGFSEVLRHLFVFKKGLEEITSKIKERNPDLIILIDSPSFNLRLAKKINEKERFLYYISPQVWAWGKGRIKKISSLVKRIIVIFPFEEEIYRRAGVPVNFVGHPFLDMVRASISEEEARKFFKLQKRVLLLLPGSRKREVKSLLPVMLKVSKRIKGVLNNKINHLPEEKEDLEIAILAANDRLKDLISQISEREKVPAHIFTEKKYDLINISHLVLSASGSATLEITCLLRPFLLLYKVSSLTSILLRPFFHLPFIGITNILAKKMVVPEFIQRNCTEKKILPSAMELWKNEEKRVKMIEELKRVKSLLGQKGAARRAAEIISGSGLNI